MLRTHTVLVGIVFLATLPLAAQEAAPPLEKPKLSPLDVFELEIASDPQISPDGSQVVYIRRSFDIERDKMRSRLWLIDVATGRHRPLVGEKNAHEPRWSPDGKRIAYRHDGQIFVKHLDGAMEEIVVTHVREEVEGIAWSPGGRWIAFTMDVPEKEESFGDIPQPPKGAEWAEAATVIDRLVYRRDGSGYVEPGYRHLFVVPAEGGTARQLTDGNFHHDGTPAWSRDGKTIYITANRNDDWEYQGDESEIWAVDVKKGTLTCVTDHAGPDESPQVSPDGKWLAILGSDASLLGYRATELTVIELATGARTVLTRALDRSVSRVQWAGDSQSLFIQYDDLGDTRIGTVALPGESGSLAAVVPKFSSIGGTTIGRPYSSGSFSVSKEGAVVYTAVSESRPADLVWVSENGRSRRFLTRLNDDLLGNRTLGRVREMSIPSPHDNLPIHGFIITPPDFVPGNTYPMILEIHGGPFANYGKRFSAELQLYAAAGYIVVYVNPRGSTGYGSEFANKIHHAYPGNDYDDLMGCVEAAIDTGAIDASNLFVTGGSGGGVLTAWIVGKTDRFRAAVVAKPVIHWTSFVLTADYSHYFQKYWFPGPPWEHHEQYWARSPLSLVGNVTTPTMLLTGEEDFRTPMSETEQYYQALKLRKVETAMVRIPGAGHGIASRPSNLIRKVAYILGWFEKHAEVP